MRKTILIALTASMLLAAKPVSAGGGQQGDVELGPYVGWAFPDDYNLARPDNDFLWGGRVGYFLTDHISIEGSWQQFKSRTNFNSRVPLKNGDFKLTSTRLNGLWNFLPGNKVRPFVTLGIGRAHSEVNDARVILPYSGYVGPGSLAGNASAAGAFGPTKSPRPQSFASRDMEYNAGGGVRWYLTDIFGLRADGRFTYSQVGEDLMKGRAKNVEATVGALWSFGGGPAPDTDRDGVIDRKDKCPDTPLGATVDERGCPMDTDGDGVLDGIDQCPDTPKGWPVDAKGCPLDSDGDGVADGADKCPNTPKGAKVDATGCPMDSDGDGVWDGIDKCPDTPKGARVDATGCPLDSDGDGVWDGLDKCPDTPRGTRVDANGCPVVVKSVEPMKDLVLIGVNFDSDKADITPDSAATLDTVVKSLKDWMDVTIVIEGHTDSTNTDAHNQRLSDARADSVRAYLVTAGVNAARITTKGYGEKQPIADNGTVEGRAQNRRVEIHRTN